jgi:hypothetical protein
VLDGYSWARTSYVQKTRGLREVHRHHRATQTVLAEPERGAPRGRIGPRH